MLDRIAVTPANDVVHNGPNAALLDGAQKLGYPARSAAMNMRDTAAVSAGWSTLGDRQANTHASPQSPLSFESESESGIARRTSRDASPRTSPMRSPRVRGCTPASTWTGTHLLM